MSVNLYHQDNRERILSSTFSLHYLATRETGDTNAQKEKFFSPLWHLYLFATSSRCHRNFRNIYFYRRRRIQINNKMRYKVAGLFHSQLDLLYFNSLLCLCGGQH